MMPLKTFLTRACLTVSALVLVSSCGGRDADVNYLPTPPDRLFERAERPHLDMEAVWNPETGEAAYEAWITDLDDWGKGLDGQVYRACIWANGFLAQPVDCGDAPAR